MAFPLTCPDCRTLNMLDMNSLEERHLSWDKISTERGYICEGCKQFKTLYYVTPSLKESLDNLKKRDVKRKDFPFHFGKTLKKAIGVQK